jgi:hypothetical protein
MAMLDAPEVVSTAGKLEEIATGFAELVVPFFCFWEV